jgi:hypothetical protein
MPAASPQTRLSRPEVGWGSAHTWAVLASIVALLGVFLAIQAGRGSR